MAKGKGNFGLLLILILVVGFGIGYLLQGGLDGEIGQARLSKQAAQLGGQQKTQNSGLAQASRLNHDSETANDPPFNEVPPDYERVAVRNFADTGSVGDLNFSLDPNKVYGEAMVVNLGPGTYKASELIMHNAENQDWHRTAAMAYLQRLPRSYFQTTFAFYSFFVQPDDQRSCVKDFLSICEGDESNSCSHYLTKFWGCADFDSLSIKDVTIESPTTIEVWIHVLGQVRRTVSDSVAFETASDPDFNDVPNGYELVATNNFTETGSVGDWDFTIDSEKLYGETWVVNLGPGTYKTRSLSLDAASPFDRYENLSYRPRISSTYFAAFSSDDLYCSECMADMSSEECAGIIFLIRCDNYENATLEDLYIEAPTTLEVWMHILEE